jgi:hypothetical protein
MALPEEHCLPCSTGARPSRVLRQCDRGDLGSVGVGSPQEGGEEDQGSPRGYLDPKGEWSKWGQHHRCISPKEGGAIDGTRASSAPDGSLCAI